MGLLFVCLLAVVVDFFLFVCLFVVFAVCLFVCLFVVAFFLSL